MPRCGCASDQCSCWIVAGVNVDVSGNGSKDNPYVVSAATVVVDDSGTPTTPAGATRLTGEMVIWGGVTAPTGWLLCDGSAVSRNVYNALFAVLSTRFGAGDGSTTFNLPNMADRVPVGASGTKTLGSAGGSDTVTLAAANLPAHTHTMNHTHAATSSNGSHDHPLERSTAVGSSNASIPKGQGTAADVGPGGIDNDGVHTHTIPAYSGSTGSAGSGTAVTVTPKYAAVNYIIKT